MENRKTRVNRLNINKDPMIPDELLFNVFLANTYLFVASKYRIYIFDLMTLEHEFSFEDVNGEEGCISMYYTKKIILSYISHNDTSIVKLNKIKILKNGLKYSQRFIATNFMSVQYIQISPKGKFLTVDD